MNFISRIKYRIECLSFLRRLSEIMRQRYRSDPSYTVAQLDSTFAAEELDQRFYPAAVAAFCGRKERKAVFERRGSEEGFCEFSDAFNDELCVQEANESGWVDSMSDHHGREGSHDAHSWGGHSFGDSHGGDHGGGTDGGSHGGHDGGGGDGGGHGGH